MSMSSESDSPHRSRTLYVRITGSGTDSAEFSYRLADSSCQMMQSQGHATATHQLKQHSSAARHMYPNASSLVLKH
jgi:hypothetical protein